MMVPFAATLTTAALSTAPPPNNNKNNKNKHTKMMCCRKIKRVKRIDDSTFQACRTVDGQQQHVWTSDDPRECAYVYRLATRFPLHRSEGLA